MSFSEEINSILKSLELLFSSYWNDENSLVKAVFDKDTLFLHFALKYNPNKECIIPLKKLKLLANIMSTGFFEQKTYLTRSTFTLIYNQPVTKDNLDKVKADINLLKGYYELIM